MIEKNLDIKRLYLLYRFLTNLDEETRIYFHDSFIHPLYKNPSSLLSYTRLFLSMVFPEYVILKMFPRLALKTATIILNQSVQGFAYLTFKQLPSSAEYESTLGMVIDERFRRMGMGTLLLGFLIREARKINATKMTIIVLKQNQSAISLYKKHGFKIIEENSDSFDGKTWKAFSMELNLP